MTSTTFVRPVNATMADPPAWLRVASPLFAKNLFDVRENVATCVRTVSKLFLKQH